MLVPKRRLSPKGEESLPASCLLEEIKGPACLVSSDEKTVLSMNSKARRLLGAPNPEEDLSQEACFPGHDEVPVPGLSEAVFPGDLSSLRRISGEPRKWSVTMAEMECLILIFPDPSQGSAREMSFPPKRSPGPRPKRPGHKRAGWSRRSFSELFQKSPVAFLYAEDLKVRRANPALCSLLGYEEPELAGRSLAELFRMPDRDRAQFDRFLEGLNRRDSVLREMRLWKKGGGILEAMVFAIPFLHREGESTHFFFVQEVSERKELERLMLRNSMVVTRSPLVVFQGELGDRFTLNYVSENVSRFGYCAEELVRDDMSFYSLIHPDDLGRIPKRADPEEGSSGRREYLFRMRDPWGDYHWMNLWDRIVPGKDGEPDIVVGIILDVTERRAAEIGLQESNDLLEQQLLRLETAWEQTIELLAGITELRDPYTMGHQRRVAHLAGTLAREMNLGEEREQEIIRAGLVHDIGKIQIPSEYLSKPGKLAEKEFAIIRDHPAIGGELLKNIELPWPLATIVIQHHERMDGSGYPHGLKGDEILQAARVIAVADVVEAMASHRPYRPALGIEKALGEITRNAGRLYDAEVVSACRRLFLEKGYCLPVA